MVDIRRVQHPDVMKLGRISSPDSRDAAYSLRAVMAPGPERDTPWQIGDILNQLRVPQCVAFTCREWLNAEPQNDPDHANPTPQQLYDLAQKFDGIPMPHDGSTDHGMMKGLETLGLVDAYHWASNVDDAIQYLLTTGTLMAGSNWTQAMFTPDPTTGFVRPLGPVEGGHEYHIYWYSRAEAAFWVQQSWGPDWNAAFPGRFKILRTDVDTLFAQGMDFCAAQIAFPRPVTPPLAPPPTPKPVPHRKRWRFNPFSGWTLSVTRKDGEA